MAVASTALKTYTCLERRIIHWVVAFIKAYEAERHPTVREIAGRFGLSYTTVLEICEESDGLDYVTGSGLGDFKVEPGTGELWDMALSFLYEQDL